MIVHTVARPFSYLYIKHPHKWRVDWLLPSLFCVVVLSILYFGDVSGGNKIAWNFLDDKIFSLVSILPGFYIAALSAITVFNRSDIDRHMPEPTPSIKIYKKGGEQLIKLTRRRFLAITFSFLTAESIIILVVIGLGPAFQSIAEKYFEGGLYIFSKSVYYFGVVFMFSQLVCITFLCLYYLGERLHQPDPL